MAYGLKKISPLDLRPSTGIGVAIPFDGQSVFRTVYTTKEQIKYNIINYLLTDPRERPFNPTFGAGLRARLFNQIDQDTFDSIEETMRTQIEAFFPQVQVTSINVTGDPDRNSINIKFSYKLLASRDTDQVTVTVQN